MSEKKTPLTQLALFFLVVLACYGLFLHPLPGDNVNSRLDLTAAIVNEGTFRIDSHHQNTIDKAFVGGHYYSDKAPGTSWWALPVAYAARRWGPVNPDDVKFRHLASLLVVSIPAALATAFFALFLQRLGGGSGASFTIAAFYALGTLNFPYSTMFYSHALTGSISLIIFAIIFLHRKNGRTMGPCAALLCGLLAGAMVAGEYPAALTAALLFVYSLFAVRKRQHAVFFILGMAPFVAAVMAYNNAAFGSPFTTGYVRESLPVFNEGMDRGFAGITVPSLETIYKTLLSPGRGFIWQSPFLLFAIPGWLAMRRREYRLESWIVLAIAFEVIAVGVSAYMPEGGMAVGPRYLIPALPFLCVPLVFLPFEKASARRIFLGLGVASILLMFIATATDPQVPREFDSTIVEFNLPLLCMRYLRPMFDLFNGFHPKDISIHVMLVLAIFLILVSAQREWMKDVHIATQASSIPTYKMSTLALFTVIIESTIIVLIYLGSFYALNLPSLKQNAARKYCSMGSYLHNSGNYLFNSFEALQWYREGLAAEGDSWKCHFGLGMLYKQNREYEKAESHFLELIITGRDLPQVYFNLGDIYFSGYKDYDRAFSLYEKSAERFIATNDIDSAINILRFISLKDKKRKLEALKEIEKALQIFRRNPEARENLGRLKREIESQINP